jgi:predicted nucleic acid-binding protein
MFLVDTNVLSAGAPGRVAPAGLIEWMDRNSGRLFIAAITVAEIHQGIAKARREGAMRKADDLTAWMSTLLHLYPNRVLPLDADVAKALGEIADHARAIGRPPGLADLIIAATVLHYGLTILTRNTRHFEPLGVKVHDPFVSLPV